MDIILGDEEEDTMNTNHPFQQLFNNFLRELEDADKHQEVASNFGPKESSESMFKYIWGLSEAHQRLDFNLIESTKSQTKSDQLRSEGNIHYQKGDFDQALQLYNMCIMLAPHPSKKSQIKEALINNLINNLTNNSEEVTSEQPKSTCLAYGFANRSAILCELEQYDKSIKDIDCALKYGYPTEQIFKLAERKAKCLIGLKKQQDAKTLLNSTIDSLSTSNMDEAKKKSNKNKLLSLLKKCQQVKKDDQPNEENIPSPPIDKGVNPCEDRDNKNEDEVDPSEAILNQIATDTPSHSIPRLAIHHSTILSVSSALRLQYTPEQGRFFVADRDIKPGELILVEKAPFGCLHLQKDILDSHCCVCLMKCNNPLPCHSCTMVMFCSEACQSESVNGHGVVECSTLPTLASLYMGNYCPLVFKVITQLPYTKLINLIPNCKKQLAESFPNLYGFNKIGMFDSSDFISTYALVDNISARNGNDLFKRAALSFILTKLLVKSDNYFINSRGVSFVPTDEDSIILGSTLMTLTMSLPCNAHSIEEFQTRNNDIETIRDDVGAAVFPAQSLLNHSCNPSSVRSTIGNHMTTYAIRFIPEGSEVTDSYGCHYAQEDIDFRQADLKKQYHFQCKCEACLGEWEVAERLSSTPKFKSLKDTNMNENFKDEKDYQEEYKKLKSNFQKAYFDIIKGDINEENKQAVLDLIEFFDKCIVLPCKMYYDVQESLKLCIDKEVSRNRSCI